MFLKASGNFNRIRLNPTSASSTYSTAASGESKYFALEYVYAFKGQELAEKRAPYRSAHLEYARKCPTLKMGGAWGDLSGGLLIFYGANKDAEEFAKRDPYTINGIVKSWSVREWIMVHTKYDGVPTAKI